MRYSSIKRNMYLMSSLLVLSAVMFSPLVRPAQAQSGQKFNYGASAFGTYVVAGTIVKSGPTALVGLGCTTQPGASGSNTSATVNVPLVGSVGVTNTSVSSALIGQQHRARAISTVANVNLLGGLIQASTIKAQSTTTHDPTSGFVVSAAGSSFASLNILGIARSLNPAPNTTIPLPGIGYVILNQQNTTKTATTASLTVTMIHVAITVANNTTGLAPGTHIYIARATSSLTGPVASLVGGYAYGTRVNVGNTIISGPTSVVSIPCLGGTSTNSVLTLNVPNVLVAGTIATTATGTVTATGASARTTASVQTVTIGSGLIPIISATGVKAQANATLSNGTITLSDTGSQFGSISVLGVVRTNVAANTVINVPGVGTLYLHRVIRGTRGITVRMIELVITSPTNSLGLAVGTTIQVSVANAGFPT